MINKYFVHIFLAELHLILIVCFECTKNEKWRGMGVGRDGVREKEMEAERR